MNRRTLACLLAVAPSLACSDRWEPGVEEIHLPVDVRLNAVDVEAEGGSFMAVGSNGTIVSDDGRIWQVGDVELRDIQYSLEWGVGPLQSFLLVVGDAGTVFVGRPVSPTEIEWTVQDTGTTANLFGVALIDESTAIVVGDEVVLIGQQTVEREIFEWVAEPAPPGGWGQLRDVEAEYEWWSQDGVWIRAVGLQGRIWLVDETLEQWLSVDAGTDEDLVDIYYNRICGTGGTVVTCGGQSGSIRDECISERVGEVDFVACHNTGLIGSDRRIYVEGEGSYLLDWQPRAIDDLMGIVVVGDSGHVGRWWPDPGFDL